MLKLTLESGVTFLHLMSLVNWSVSGGHLHESRWTNDLDYHQAFSEGFGMLESGVEDEHIALINNQMEFGSTIGMVPWLIPYTKWTFLPIPWLQNIQAGRERLKEVR